MQAIFFDAHRILYDRPYGRQHLRRFLEQQGLQMPAPEQIQEAIQAIRQRASCGLVEPRAVYEAVLDVCGMRDPALRDEGCRAQTEDHAAIILYPRVPETLSALKTRGFMLGVITNTIVSTAEKLRWLHEQGLDLAWDVFASSSEVGAAKPQPQIYEWALHQSATLPQEAVFVGHSASDLAGASEVEMVTVAVHPDPGARADYTLDHFSELLGLPILS